MIFRFFKRSVSSEEKLKILHGCHVDKTAGHMGREKTINRINERYNIMWLGIVIVLILLLYNI